MNQTMKNQIKLLLGAVVFVGLSAQAQFPAAYDELSQTVATTAGDSYDISFWVAAQPASYLRSYFGGSLGLELNNVGYFDWTQYSYVAQATGNSMQLQFWGNNVPSWVGVANVSVTDAIGGGNLVSNGNMSAVTGGIPDDWILTLAAYGSDTGLNIDQSAFGTIPGGDGANFWSFGAVGNPVGVPDSGYTMALMSAAMLGLGGIARKLRR